MNCLKSIVHIFVFLDSSAFSFESTALSVCSLLKHQPPLRAKRSRFGDLCFWFHNFVVGVLSGVHAIQVFDVLPFVSVLTLIYCLFVAFTV